jgi:hypothetical protein
MNRQITAAKNECFACGFQLVFFRLIILPFVFDKNREKRSPFYGCSVLPQKRFNCSEDFLKSK